MASRRVGLCMWLLQSAALAFVASAACSGDLLGPEGVLIKPVSPAVSARDVTAAFFQAKSGSIIDFSGRNLRDLDLSGLDFHAARLAGADLFGADLTSANLAGVAICWARRSESNARQ